MAMGYIKTPFGKPRTTLPTEAGKVPNVNETSIIQTPTITSVSMRMVSSTEGLPNDSPLTTFLTLVKDAPPEHPTVHNKRLQVSYFDKLLEQDMN